jgi:MOSC domain-containing protein YiiM
MAEVLAVCISEVRGICKHPVDSVHLIPDHGIEGDAHAGHWHRQVSLLAQESVDGMQSKITTVQLKPGDFAENVLTRGIDLKTLPVGTRLRIGSALCEVTQIGKECHADCAIRQQVGDCVMPREGIFVKVLTEGHVRPGDSVEIEQA